MGQSSARVVIVGAGHAGGVLAGLLRQYGHAGSTTLLGAEAIAPYQRPPLSKAWLKGEATAESLALKPLAFYAEHQITFRPRATVARIDRAEQTLRLLDGSRVAYDITVIATGLRPNRLAVPGADLGGVLTLRSIADAEALKLALGPGKTIGIVGGGYIGLEVAASARALGADAVVFEREDRLLARTASPALSTFFYDYHSAWGVRFELGAQIVGFAGAQGAVARIILADGRTVPADLVLLGVGGTPNDDLAADAGLETSRGVVVDLEARTSDPAIFAIGDATCRPMPHYDRMFGPESVPSALEQAKQAACAITGRPTPAPEVPWNWSDQYDLKLQMAGLAFDADQIVLRGDPGAARFAVFHLRGDQVRAVEAINAPAEFMAGRSLIASQKPVDPGQLRNLAISMKAFV